MKKLIIFVILVAALGSAGWAYYANRSRPEPVVTTLPVSRGDVAETVQATGTLEAVTTVDVGTQVSGVVQELYADFNSIVRKGQVVARLDPSILETQIESQRANVIRAEADLERLRVALADAKQKMTRAQAMFDRQLIPKTELETADINVKSADAQIKSSEASLTQSRAALNQAQVNLGYTVIHSPIDGIVIQRSVDPGQTVASSMNAPTLFVIAADLSKMQVVANIDESEIGRIRPGQHVNFRVDAYPTEQFSGSVEQVRLQPTVVQNVVVYSTVIAVPNVALKLVPGMTANVTIEVARRTNVLRVPTAALRFRPTELMFTVLNQEVPPEARPGRGGFGGGRGGRRGQDGTAAGAAPAGAAPGATAPAGAPPAAPAAAAAAGAKPTPPAPTATAQAQPPAGQPSAGGDRPQGQGGERAQGQGGGGGRGGFGFDPNMTPEERRKRMEERLAQMTPEERQRFEERMKQRQAGGGGAPGEGGRGFGPGGGGGRGQGPGQGPAFNANAAPGAPGAPTGRRDITRGVAASASGGAAVTSGHTTIDSLFAPIQIAETPGRVWAYTDKHLKSVRVRTGVTDGTFSEIVEGEVTEGQEVVVSMVTGLEPRTPTGGQGAGNPLMGPQRGGGPGGPGGGNRGGGGGRGF